MIPIGGIALWSGTLLDIPAGWQLCDGTDGTPDLRGKFIKGAGPDDAVDGEGGGLVHTHAFSDDGHTHEFDGEGHVHGDGGEVNVQAGSDHDVWNADDDSASADAAGTTDSGNAAGTTDNGGNLPPFYNLAYIQRML